MFKIIAGYIFYAGLLTFGLYILNLWIESIKEKDWLGIFTYIFMAAIALITAIAGALHLKGWL